jgi:hypothetical protein
MTQRWTVPVAEEPARRAKVVVYHTNDEVRHATPEGGYTRMTPRQDADLHVEDRNRDIQAFITLNRGQVISLRDALDKALGAMNEGHA